MTESGASSSQGVWRAPIITPDGRYVAFSTESPDLAPNDNNGSPGSFNGFDVFVRDRGAGRTILVSVNRVGTGTGNGSSVAPVITPDGRYVAFVSHASDLVGPEFGVIGASNVYLRDLQAGTTTLVSQTAAGLKSVGSVGTAGDLPNLSISADGRYVAFLSSAADLTPVPDTNCAPLPATPQNGYDIFVRDVQAGTTRLVSANRSGEGSGSRSSASPFITPDGRHVLFLSWADDLVGNDTNWPNADAFVNVNLVPAGQVQFAGHVFRASEAAGHAAVSVTRAPGAAGAATVEYATLGGTAQAGSEFAHTTGTLTFAPGETSKQFLIPLFDDPADEADETVFVRLKGEAGAVGEPALASVLIEDDDPSPRLTIGDARVGEGDGGAPDLAFLVTLSEPSPRAVSVSFTTQGGTAAPGVDFNTFSGTLTFPPGSTRGLLKVRVRPDTLSEGDETLTVVLSNAPNAEMADGVGVGTIVDDDGAVFTKVQLSASTYTVAEAAGRLDVQVVRAGDLSSASSVGYATSDFRASGRSDYNAAAGVLRFAPGESSRTLTLFITDDALREDAEPFFITLFAPAGCTLGAIPAATVMIESDDAADGPSPVGAQFDAAFYVRQHYRDFLGRDPDEAGLRFWQGEIEGCGTDAACREVKRVNVSAAFFLSIEFQETGYLVYRTYKAAYGKLAGRPVPLQTFWFLHDAQQIGFGVVVNQGDWRARLEQNKRDYFDDFVRGELFGLVYPESLTPEQFVGALDGNAGGVLTAAERAALAGALGAGTLSRAGVLRAVAENQELARREFNRAFVLMQYFGYLRRDPDAAPEANRNFAGYNFWLEKLEQFGGNYIEAEMVKAFISSDEYRKRFGL